MLRFAVVLFVLVAALVVLRRLTPHDVRPVLACSESDFRHDVTCTEPQDRELQWRRIQSENEKR